MSFVKKQIEKWWLWPDLDVTRYNHDCLMHLHVRVLKVHSNRGRRSHEAEVSFDNDVVAETRGEVNHPTHPWTWASQGPYFFGHEECHFTWQLLSSQCHFTRNLGIFLRVQILTLIFEMFYLLQWSINRWRSQNILQNVVDGFSAHAHHVLLSRCKN